MGKTQIEKNHAHVEISNRIGGKIILSQNLGVMLVTMTKDKHKSDQDERNLASDHRLMLKWNGLAMILYDCYHVMQWKESWSVFYL